MTVISPGDVSVINNARQVTTRPVLNMLPLTEVASATISAANGAFPVRFYSVTNTSAGWTDEAIFGRAYSIETDEGNIVQWGAIRFNSTATLFYPDVKSQGDFGFATNRSRSTNLNYIIRVYMHRLPIAFYSRVAEDTTSFKRWTTPYTDEGRRPKPVINIGPHRQAWATGGTARLTFDASSSVGWLTGSVTTFQWVLPSSGATLVAGYSLTDATIEVDFTPGNYEIQCLGTDGALQFSPAFRYVFINDDTNQPFGDRHGIRAISGDRSDYDGRSMTFEINGSAKDELYPGAFCLFTEDTQFDGQNLSDGEVNNFCGYMVNFDTNTVSQQDRSVTMTFDGPIKVAKKLPSATQLLESTNNPTSWTQVLPTLNNAAYATAYILYWHTNIITQHDFEFGTDTFNLRRPVHGFRQDQIGQQLKFLEDITAGKVACRSDGTIVLRREPDLINLTLRDAYDEKFAWDDSRIRGPLRLRPQLRPQVAEVIMDGIENNTTDPTNPGLYRSKAPGYASGQGLSKNNLPAITISNGGGPQELYEITGHYFAYLNNPLASVELQVVGMLDILEPADTDWHRLNIPDAYWPVDINRFGTEMTDNTTRFRPVSVRRRWEFVNGSWLKDISATIRVESYGTPGVFWPIDRLQAPGAPGTTPWFGLDPDDPIAPQEPIDTTITNYDLALARNGFGLVGNTFNFDEDVVFWGGINGTSLGSVVDFCWAYNEGGTAPVYLLTWDDIDSVLYVYFTPDASIDFPNWFQQASWDVPEGWGGSGRILASGTMAMVVFYWNGHSQVARKTGINWPSAFADFIDVGPSIDLPTVIDPRLPGAWLDGDAQYVPSTAVFSPGGGASDITVIRLFSASGTGLFTEIANHPGDAEGSTDEIYYLMERSGFLYSSYFVNTNTPLVTPIDVLTLSSTYRLASSIPLPPPFTGSKVDAPSNPAEANVYGAGSLYGNPDGAVWDIDEIEFSFVVRQSYPASVAGSPANPVPYFPPVPPPSWSQSNFNVTYELICYNSRLEPLSYNTFTWEADDTSYPYVISYVPDLPATPQRITFEQQPLFTVSFATPLQDVRFVSLRVFTEPLTWGSGVYDAQEFERFRIGFNSVEVTANNERLQGRRLYKINTSTEAWEDVTPIVEDEEDEDVGQPFTPDRFNALAIEGSAIAILTSDSGKRRVGTASAGADDWTVQSETPYTWVKRPSLDITIAGGPDRLVMSRTNLTLSNNRLGDYRTAVGPTDNILDALLDEEYQNGAP